MSWNSVIPYADPKLKEIADSLGITQFQGLDSWFQVLGGLIIQGGKVAVPSSANVTVLFPAPFRQQVLGIFIEETDVAASIHSSVVTSSLSQFTFAHNHTGFSVYWFALGV